MIIIPQLGDVTTARALPERKSNGLTKYIWIACPFCGKERWVQYVKGKPINIQCLPCFHKRNVLQWDKNPAWKGGKYIGKRDGYVRVRVKPDDFFYPMARQGYAMEHRLIVAKALGRCLLPWEVVHHKGQRYTDIRNRSDNRYPENLQLLPTTRYHLPDSLVKARMKRLEKRIAKQMAEILRLKDEVRKWKPKS